MFGILRSDSRGRESKSNCNRSLTSFLYFCGALFPRNAQVDPKADLCSLVENRFHTIRAKRNLAHSARQRRFFAAVKALSNEGFNELSNSTQRAKSRWASISFPSNK